MTPFFPLQEASATAIGHIFVTQTTRQTTTSNVFSDISGAVINDADLTDGKKYLLVFTAQTDSASVSFESEIKAIHGSTDFEGSLRQSEPETATTGKMPYFWFTVWTAVAGESVKLQFASGSDGTTIGADQITMTAIKLSDDLTENTDWFFSEVTTDTTVQSLYVDDTNTASVTFTPNGSDDILVLATANLDPDSATVEFSTRISASGGVTDTGVEWFEEADDATNEREVQTLGKVYTPTAVSTTFETETQRESADGGTKLYNAIFTLNLNKFDVHSFQATAAEINLDTTNAFATSTNVATTSITPSLTGDVWSLGFLIYDPGSVESYKVRMQVNNTDAVATQTSDNYISDPFSDATDELGWAMQNIDVQNSGASRTADVDATKATTARPVEDRLAMMVTMELAGGADNCDPTCTQAVSDGIKLGDSPDVNTIKITPLDGINLGDSADVNTIKVTPTDGIILGDAPDVNDVFLTQSDGLILGDSPDVNDITIKTNDGIILGDSPATTSDTTAHVSDGMIFNDSPNAITVCDVTCTKSVSDGLILGDSTSNEEEMPTLNAIVIYLNSPTGTRLGGVFAELCSEPKETMIGINSTGHIICADLQP